MIATAYLFHNASHLLLIPRSAFLHPIALPDLPGFSRERLHHLLAYPASIVLQLLPALLVEHIRCPNKGPEDRMTRINGHIAIQLVGKRFKRCLKVFYGDGFAAEIVCFVGRVAEEEHVGRK
jgi:hypothetical protein